MITYTDKGPWLLTAIAAAGHWLQLIDGVFVTSDDAAVQTIIDGFNPLPHAIAEAEAASDAAAGAARARYITVAPGQEATYQIKEAQARAYLATGTIGGMMQAEADALGQTVAAVAATVVATADAWIQLATGIEALRIGGKAQVRAATDWTAIAPIVGSVTATLGAL